MSAQPQRETGGIDRDRPIRVGLIGAHPERGWARATHLPALAALPAYAITAVATRNPDSARAAAERYGARHALTDPAELAAHPDVDLVTVAVKVPHHAELVAPALAAGKPVYCEWPLGRTTAEAADLTGLATRAGVLTAVGLQGRFAPEIRYARTLIEQGYVGRVSSVAVRASHARGATGEIATEAVYTTDKTSGAGVLEIIGGHTLDVVRYLVGEVEAVGSMLSRQRSRYLVTGTGETIHPTAPDHLVLTALLKNGAVASAHLNLGKVSDQRTTIEIAGTRGDLVLTTVDSKSLYGSLVQIGELRLLGGQLRKDLAEIVVPERYRAVVATGGGLPGVELGNAVGNVARLYAGLAAELRGPASGPASGVGEPIEGIPDFADALALHRLLDAIRRAGEERSVVEVSR